MKSCAPKGHQIALTAKALIDLCNMPLKELTEACKDLSDQVWVHWPSVVKELGQININQNRCARTILDLWEGDTFLELPGDTELPAIAALNNTPGYEDNVSVYCSTFSEYVELRKTYGKEDIFYFRRI